MTEVAPVKQIPQSLRWLRLDVVCATCIVIGAVTMSTLGYIDAPYQWILALFARSKELTGLQFVDWIGCGWGMGAGLAAIRWSRSWSWLRTFILLWVLCAATLVVAIFMFNPIIASIGFAVPLLLKLLPAWGIVRLARLIVWNLERAGGDGEAEARCSLWAAGSGLFCFFVRPRYYPTVLPAVGCAALAALLAVHWWILRSRKGNVKPTPGVDAIVTYRTKEDALHGISPTLCYDLSQAAALLGVSKKSVCQLVADGTLSPMTHKGKKLLFEADVVREAARQRIRTPSSHQ
jgi:hypothetical protein